MKRSRWGSSFGARESFKGVGPPPYPPPFRGRDFSRTRHRILAARCAPEVCRVMARNPTGPARSGRPDDKLRDEAIQSDNIRTGLLRLARNNERTKEAERRQAHGPACPHHGKQADAICATRLPMRRAPTGCALACRRSTTALAKAAFARFAQLQARLPGTRQGRTIKRSPPKGGERSSDHCAATRALPAPACPSPGKAPPAPVVVPASVMPEAARERNVSFRARAPHSLRFQEYPRERRPSMSEIRLVCN